MAIKKWQLRSMIRCRSAGVLGQGALTTYWSLVGNQPLLLVPEPTNTNDRNAILVTDLVGAPCGYVAREHAAAVGVLIRQGWVLMAKVLSPAPTKTHCRILIWSDGEAEREVESEFKIDRAKSKKKIDFNIKIDFEPIDRF
jgi:hypothetical protein